VRAVRNLTIDVEDEHQGGVMEEIGRRRGELTNMESDGKGRTRLEYHIPARGLIGFQGDFMTMTRGTGLMSHVFDDYGPVKADAGPRNGVLISQDTARPWPMPVEAGRSRPHVREPGDKLYEGMIIGIHSRDNDLVVNPIKGKQLTNVRASGTDEAVRLTADQADAGIGGRIHRRRRTGGNHAEVDPHPQALPEGTRAQARQPRERG
jgi:GTP-binding protein